MELFKDANYDFLGKKLPFIAVSLVLLAASVVSLIVIGPTYGIDFKGGTMAQVKFATRPSEDEIRSALSSRVEGEITVQAITGAASENEVMIGTELKSEEELEAARQAMLATLRESFGHTDTKPDFNAIGIEALVSALREPFQNANVAVSDDDLRNLARKMLDYRDSAPRSGLLTSFDDLKSVQGVTQPMVDVIKQNLSLAPFAVRSFDLVGPKIGAELRQQAIMATLFALGGMLVYIALRFEWIYGVAAVLAVFHDTIITIGLFSILGKEISLTVVAALLTLVGYSMNDTIVVFDRIRENLKVMRKESYPTLVNLSINQTLSRTVMASGLTFVTVLALWLFGGSVLNGFSFALVVGIIIGTYSSIFIASPVLVWWYDLAESRKKRSVPSAPVARQSAGTVKKEKAKNKSKVAG